MLDDRVFDRALEVGFLSFLASSLLPGLKKLLNQSSVLLSGFCEFVAKVGQGRQQNHRW